MRSLGVTLEPGPARDRLGRAHLPAARPRAAADRAAAAPPLPAGNGHVQLRGVTLRYDDPDELRRAPTRTRRRRRHDRAARSTTAPQRSARRTAAGATGGRERRAARARGGAHRAARHRPRRAGRAHVALVGATGSGKTSLVSLISRLYDASEGEVLLDGADVREVDLRSLRRAVAVVSDDPFLFSASVAENIAYARPEAGREEIEAGRPARPGARVHRAPAAGLRDARRRARPDAVRRPAPAPGDRARAAGRPARADPRRRHLLGGRLHRAGDQAGAGRGDGGPHDVHHRPPPLDDRAGRRDRRARPRAHRRPRRPRTSCSSSPTCIAKSSTRGCPSSVFLTQAPAARGRAGCELSGSFVGGGMSAGHGGGRAALGGGRGLGPGAAAAAAVGRRARARGSRGRNLRGLLGAAAPLPRTRRRRCSSRCVLGTAASLAPPLLAKAGDRPGHQQARHRRRSCSWSVAFLLRGAARVGDDLRPDLPRRLGRPARAGGPADPHLHPPAAPADRLLREPPGGRADLAHDQRRRGAGKPRDRLGGDAVPVGADADRRDRGAAVPRPEARAADVLHRAVRGRRQHLVPARLGRRLPAHAGDDRLDHRLPAGDAVGHPRGAQLRPGAGPRGPLRRAQRGQPRGQHGHRAPQRHLLPGRGNAVRRGDRGDRAVRRATRRSKATSRRARSWRSWPTLSFLFEPIQQLSQLYTTYQSGMAALEKIFQLLDVEPDLAGRPGARGAPAASAGEISFEDISFAYQPRAPAAARRRAGSAGAAPGDADDGHAAPDEALALDHVDLRDPGRPDGRAGGRHRRRQVDDGQAGRPLLRPHRGTRAGRRPRPARHLELLAALADGDRAPGGVPVLRHDRREHRLRPPRRRRGGDPRRPPPRWASRSSSPS